MKAKPSVEFRVIKLPRALVEAVRRRRDADDVSTVQFVWSAVFMHLPAVMNRLREIGITATSGEKQAVRLPFSTRHGTLNALHTASRESGLSASLLLTTCLVEAANPRHPNLLKRLHKGKRSGKAPAATGTRRPAESRS